MSNESGNGSRPPRKVGSGEFQAVGPEEETWRAPPADDLEAKMRHLEEALTQVSSLCVELKDMLFQTRVAQLTSEHRINTQRSKIIAGGRVLIAHEREMRELRAELRAVVASIPAPVSAGDPRVDP